MIEAIELQVLSRILTTDSEYEIDILSNYRLEYYSIYKEQMEYIFNHIDKYGHAPDIFTFQAQYPDITLVKVSESLEYLVNGLIKNRQQIMLIETFNKLKNLGSGDVSEAWKYLSMQCDKVAELDSQDPLDIIKDAKERSQQIIEFSKQARIPTGFAEIDKLMYGGLSTVEELLLIVARTNSGKSWVCTKMMESSQKNGFPVLYYSPEMQASYLGTRFDTWRGHFQNSQLHQGKYTPQYIEYIESLSEESVSAFVLEDKDTPGGSVNVRTIENIVKRHKIKLVIVDGLSYMEDIHRSDTDYVKYKNICLDLFKLSKKYGCAVVIAMQANRETKESKDDKGLPFPSLMNVEGSDHPGRIATQAFSLRQIFDKHVLDIRLEKSRIANNQKPVLSYAWDVNTGNMQYLPGGDDDPVAVINTPTVVPTSYRKSEVDSGSEFEDDDFDDNVEF